MKELISVIVPVYNSERYIRDCVESVLNQTYSCFEMILVDDGSGDNSRDICRELCMQDERLRLISGSHRGVSVTRNTGIEAAEGKYLFFLDSDDIIHPQLLEFLYRLMEEKGAAVGTQRRYRTEEEGIRKPKEWKIENYEMVENVYLENESALNCRVFASPETALSGIGGKMILKSALESVRFSEKLSRGEDTLFMYQVLSGGADAVVLCRDWYCYRKHAGGTTNKLSAVSCSDIYKAECCIRNQEIERGRKQNALSWELSILFTIMGWYKSGRKNHDDVLMRYAKSRADIEREQAIYRQVSRMKRLEIFLLFYCYPLRHMYFLYPFVMRSIYRIHTLVSYPGICYRKVLNLIHIHRWRVRWVYRKVLNLIHIHRWRVRWVYRKVLNLIHIHRWRVRWAYKNVKWKATWAGQMIWIIIRRSIWKMMDVYHVILRGRRHFDGE